MNSVRNKVQLIGHLGADPAIKILSGNKSAAKVSIATTDNYQVNGVWQEDTQWHFLTFWGKLGERAARVLKKGSYVMVEGKIKYNTFQDEQGNQRYFTDIMVSNFIVLDKQNEKAEVSTSSEVNEESEAYVQS